MSIYIVEIPHQRPPRCWSAPHRAAIIRLIEQAHEPGGGIDEFLQCSAAPPTYWQYLDMNGHDLHSQMVFDSEAKAREALADENNWKRHGGLAARTALAAELVATTCHE